jgi:hypothetical protein
MAGRITIAAPWRLDLPLSTTAGAHTFVPNQTPVMLKSYAPAAG